MHGLTAWLRTERALAVGDLVLAVALAVLGLAGHIAARSDANVEAAPAAPGIVIVALLASALVWVRRSRPLVAMAAFVLAVIIGGALHDPGLFAAQLAVELMVLCHAIGRWSTRPRRGQVVVVTLAVVITAAAARDATSLFAALAFAAALVLLPWFVGVVGRTRMAYLHEVEQRLADAEREREERADAAVVAERARIARELHDVVAHHVSLIGVQAGAARATLDIAPERTRAALSAIESSSREAIGEMRRLLDVLRPLGDGGGLAPQPTLGELPALVQRWGDAGLRVELSAAGPVGDLAPAVSTSAFRIVEEAITNVARHSTAASAFVTVQAAGGGVTVEIVDPGPGRPVKPSDAPTAGSGRGVLGMRERTALFGGGVEAGPHGQGYRVLAWFPGDNHG